MVRTLQKKFIVTSMTAITVLLLLLLGAINVVNILVVGNEMEMALNIIAENEGNVQDLAPRPLLEPLPGEEAGTALEDGSGTLPEDGAKTQSENGEETRPENGAQPQSPKGKEPWMAHGFSFPELFMNGSKNDNDIFLSSNFFVVRFNEDGRIVYVDTRRTSAVRESEATHLAATVFESGEEDGKEGKYRYRVVRARENGGTTIVFLDASNEIVSYIRVLVLSGGIGIVCWGLMLLFVMLLSKRAIRPIAENIEKQRRFVTDAGHEIKTPLAIIQSNTEAMELYNGENKWSKNIREQTRRLADLTQNLLMLSRMDEADVQVAASRFSFSELLEEMIRGFLQPMEMKGICLQKEISSDVFLCADKKHMEQLVSILLDNAVKYTNSDGRIWIGLHKANAKIWLQVQNTCDGLPEVLPEKLFDRFYRADEARTRESARGGENENAREDASGGAACGAGEETYKSGGYGIGLSMARSLVKANGGKIYAKYLREGEEIVFVVEFKSSRG